MIFVNTQQLECFVQVAEKLNFTKAAEELCITTPAVTHHIKNLEQELGTTLFTRNSKMVMLTKTGSSFYQDAKGILDKMNIAEKKVKKIASQNLATLKIGCSSQTELKLFEKALIKINNDYKAIYPQIIIKDYYQLKSLFETNQLDVLLATKEMINNLNNCVFKKIKNIKSYAIVPYNHELALKKELNFSDLKNTTIITLHPRLIPFQYGNKLQELIALHSQKHLHITCDDEQSALLLVKCNYGIAILPEINISKNDNISIIPFTNKQSTLEYGIVYHKGVNEKYIIQFIEYLLQSMKS